jgi:hypothetical protein
MLSLVPEGLVALMLHRDLHPLKVARHPEAPLPAPAVHVRRQFLKLGGHALEGLSKASIFPKFARFFDAQKIETAWNT